MSKRKGLYERIFKRLFDFLLSLLAIIFLLPLLLFIYILVRIKHGKPAIFIQQRPGKNNKIFKMYKYRTMTNQKNSSGNFLPDEVRLTKFGKFLRSTSLDELPELLNILKGDMSFIGPRPLLVEYLDRYTEDQKRRHNVRPGMTGYAQVNGRNGLAWEERFDFDIKYINNISFLNDVRIAFKTVKIIFLRKGISSKTSDTMEEFKGID